MMGDLVLKGLLNLKGTLTLADKVIIDGAEALVESVPPGEAAHSSSAPPVIMPPPPAGPIDPGTSVWVVNSFNKTVTTGNKPIVALGMVMQGNIPTWPGMVLPSQVNAGPVSINFIPINVVNDQAVIFPSGGTAVFSASGQ